MTFPKYFLQILCSLLCVVSEVSVPLARWLASGLRDFLKCQEPKKDIYYSGLHRLVLSWIPPLMLSQVYTVLS